MHDLTSAERDRFLSKIGTSGEGCWIWGGGINNVSGYGQFSYRRDGKVKCARAHRMAYELLVGPIPEGLTIDHLCRTKACVRPDHLEPVTHLENMRRVPKEVLRAANRNGKKTHCPKGHPYEGDNVAVYKGKRHCRTCNRENARKVYARKAAA